MWTKLDFKDIEMGVGKLLLQDPDLTMFVTKETAHNGAKTFIQMGLGTVEDFDKTADFDKLFNSPLKKTVMTNMIADFRQYVQEKTPADVWTTAFPSAKERSALKKVIIESMYKTISFHMFGIRNKMLLLRKIPNDNGKSTVPLVIDKSLTVEDFSTNDKTVDALQDLTYTLDSFKTPSIKHTKFSVDNKDAKLVGNFGTSDFLMVWNLKYKNKVRKALSTLYNWDKIIAKGLSEQTLDFDKLEMSDFRGNELASNSAELAKIKKTVGFLIHKKAIVQIMPTGGEKFLWDWRNPNDNALETRLNTIFGVGRLPWFPIVELISK